MRQTVNELAPHVADKVEPELTVIIPVYSEEATLSALFCLYAYAVSTLASWNWRDKTYPMGHSMSVMGNT